MALFCVQPRPFSTIEHKLHWSADRHISLIYISWYGLPLFKQVPLCSLYTICLYLGMEFTFVMIGTNLWPIINIMHTSAASIAARGRRMSVCCISFVTSFDWRPEFRRQNITKPMLLCCASDCSERYWIMISI